MGLSESPTSSPAASPAAPAPTVTVPRAAKNAAKPAARPKRRVRRESERHARLMQLAEMGKLATGLAHELKNPLSTLKLNLQLLQEDLAPLPGAEASRNRAATLWRVADRLTQTLEDFLRYAGRLEIHSQSLALNLLVQDLVDFLQPQAQAANVRIHTSLTPDNPVVSLDPTFFKQALFNLMINAVQAMPNGGDLIIRTHITSDAAMVDIADTGVGIPKDNIDRIFDAYFTTKKGGTGLGLPTTRRIVEEHHGHVTVTSETGKGTNFRLEFPLNPPAPSASQAHP